MNGVNSVLPVPNPPLNPFIAYQQAHHTSPQPEQTPATYYASAPNTIPPLNRPYENPSNNQMARRGFSGRGICFNCGRSGHMAKDCWSSTNVNGQPVQRRNSRFDNNNNNWNNNRNNNNNNNNRNNRNNWNN